MGQSTCFGYVCRGGDFDGGHCVKGQSTVYYYKDEAKYQYLYETYPDIVSPLIGVKNEHFNVWLRLGGLSDFRKLYGRITSTLDKGTILQFKVKNNFNVDSFKGQEVYCGRHVVGVRWERGRSVGVLRVSRRGDVWYCAAVLGQKSVRGCAEVGRYGVPEGLVY